MGSNDAEARAAYARARELGLTKLRAEAVAHVASRDDHWAFDRTTARRVGCSRRTIQRAFSQAKSLGLMRVHRAKKGTWPKLATNPEAFKFGWSHRWVVGKGLAGSQLQRAIGEARARWLTNFERRQSKPKSQAELERKARNPEPRRPPPGLDAAQRVAWLNQEMDRELAELARKPRDGPT